jgi:voltage-gated potassium channel
MSCNANSHRLQRHSPAEKPGSSDLNPMPFLRQSITAAVLVVLTLSVQSAGMAGLIDWIRLRVARGLHKLGPVRAAEVVVRFTLLILLLHMLQILLWAAFFRWKCFPSWESAFYFSTTTYSTVGYGDLVLPQTWRMLGPIEAITGVLMCGLSASLLFAIVTRLVEHEFRELTGTGEAVAVAGIPEPQRLRTGPLEQ